MKKSKEALDKPERYCVICDKPLKSNQSKYCSKECSYKAALKRSANRYTRLKTQPEAYRAYVDRNNHIAENRRRAMMDARRREHAMVLAKMTDPDEIAKYIEANFRMNR